METKASYLTVGLFALILVLGSMGFVIWLAGRDSDAPRLRYDMIYDGSVTGLQQGSPVRLNGVRVGDVVLIQLDQKDPSKVRIGLEIFEGTPVKDDTVASLEMEGLTGGRYVLLSGGALTAGPLAMTEGEEYPIIPAEASSFEKVLAGAPDVIANINLLLERGQALLSDENIKALSEVIANTRDFTQLLADSREEIDQIIGDVSAMTGSIRETAASVENVAKLLEEKGASLIERASATLEQVGTAADSVTAVLEHTSEGVDDLLAAAAKGAKSFSSMTGEIKEMVAENREAIRDFANTGLLELAAFLSEARELVVALKNISTDVERDPARFFFGDQSEGYEAK